MEPRCEPVLLGQPLTLQLEARQEEAFWRCGPKTSKAVVGTRHSSSVLTLHAADDREVRGAPVVEGAVVCVYGNTNRGAYLHHEAGTLTWGAEPARRRRRTSFGGAGGGAGGAEVAELRVHRCGTAEEGHRPEAEVRIGDRVQLLGPDGTAVCAVRRRGRLALRLSSRAVLAPSVFTVDAPSLQHAMSLASDSSAAYYRGGGGGGGGGAYILSDDEGVLSDEDERPQRPKDAVFAAMAGLPTSLILHVLRLAPDMQPDGAAQQRSAQSRKWLLTCRLVCKRWRVALSQNITGIKVSTFHDMPRREMREEFMDFVVLCRHSLRSLSMPPMYNVTDEEAARLGALSRLQFVSFAGFRRLTDEGLAPLGRAAGMEHLNVSGTLVTDKTLRMVAECFPRLKVLNLFGCVHVTAAGLLAVAKCRELASVNIRRTHITAELPELRELGEALPGCMLLVGS